MKVKFRLEIHYKPDRLGFEPLPDVVFADGKKDRDEKYNQYIQRKNVAFIRVGYSDDAIKEVE